MMEAEREQLAMLSRDHAKGAGNIPDAASRLTGSALRAAAEMLKGANGSAMAMAQPDPADGSADAVVDMDSRWQSPTTAGSRLAVPVSDQAAEMARREAAARLAGFDEA